MLRSLTAYSAILYLLLTSTNAREWTVKTYPNPNTSDGAAACHRGNAKGSICDPDGFISPESADVVEGHIKQIEIAVSPYGSSGCHEIHADYSPGFQVAVALASSIAKQGGESSADAAKRFANDLFDAWGVGNAECGNGLLLLLAFEDRQAHIAQGDLISHFASEESLGAVIQNMKPKLKEGEFGPAVEQAVIDLGLVLAGADPSSSSSSSDTVPVLVLGIIGGFFSCVGWAIWKGSKQKKECMSLLDKLQQEQETARLTGKYPAASCPICFEDLKPLQAAQPSAPPMDQNTDGSDLSAPPPTASATQPLLSKRKSSDKIDEKAEEQQHESRSSKAEEEEEDGRKAPLCLPCGHTFCKDCLSEWLKRNANCPVCRKDVGHSGAGATRQQYAMATRGSGLDTELDRHERSLDGYQRELAFRMHRLQRRYPQYIPSSAISGGSGYVDFSSMRQQMMQSSSRANFQHSGHQGSSISFGGGSHSGHGVGGSW